MLIFAFDRAPDDQFKSHGSRKFVNTKEKHQLILLLKAHYFRQELPQSSLAKFLAPVNTQQMTYHGQSLVYVHGRPLQVEVSTYTNTSQWLLQLRTSKTDK